MCGDHWDIRHATVVCSQLGYLDAMSVETNSKFGQGNGVIHLQSMQCLGNEATLNNCSIWRLNQSNCNHSKDVGVTCNPKPCPSSMLNSNTYLTIIQMYQCLYDITTGQLIQLVNGTVPNEGRVEVRSQCNTEWSTVCSDYWDITDAQVACHQLGYSTEGLIMHNSSEYGPGTGNILLDDLGCNGTEKNLSDCQHNEINSHNCYHTKDVGIFCNKSKE